MTNTPLNQILYGPPGTGKTHSIKSYIEKILCDNKKNSANGIASIPSELENLKYYEVIALSMYHEDESENKDKHYSVPEIEKQKIIQAFFQKRAIKRVDSSIWSSLQTHTSSESKTVRVAKRSGPYLFDKTPDNETKWFLTQNGRKHVENSLKNILSYIDNNKNTGSNSKKLEDYYKFITFHQSYAYEEFVEGIKPDINEEDGENNNTISYRYIDGVFKDLCKTANADPDNKYLLIIDEINRGNISKIFGELITLIEEDKRVIPNGEFNFDKTELKGDQLSITLPYTQSKFAVPNNLYIIGTMNTSDRSIASIDIALRRRFTFIEMMPDSSLVPENIENFSLRNLMETLNKKISLLVDRDHQIGHAYFMKIKTIEELKDVWFNRILPLLNEYLYGDWRKLNLLVEPFIKKEDIPNNFPDDFKEECINERLYSFKRESEYTDNQAFINDLNKCIHEEQ